MIGLGASIFGALAGLGGGVVIKPLLDLLGDYDVGTISILSSATVFSMATVSLISSRRNHLQINIKQSFILAIGSILGGIIGKLLFNYMVVWINASDIVINIQAAMISILMILIYVSVKHRNRMKTYQLKNYSLILSMGIVLGLIAAFLGIGGGPFNVAILAIFFSMGVRESTLNSIFIIFFSQMASLLLTASTTGFTSFDLSMLFFMVSGGILGGFIGTRLTRLITDGFVEKTFMTGIIGIVFINCFNIVRFFIL